MGYEDAAATRMLATHCVCCGRPLVDAASVEAGMGPDCRRRHFRVGVHLAPEVREQANRIVHQIALAFTRQADMDIPAGINELLGLGCTALARRIAERVVQVRIEQDTTYYYLTAEYEPAAVEVLRGVPGRWWIKAEERTRFPRSQAKALWDALRRAYPGKVAMGPKGVFTI